MDILVISENKLPQFMEEFFNHKKINFFIARGSIHCQSILNTKKIQRIFFFYTSSTQKIEKELIQVINQKPIPVALFFETADKKLSLQKSSITQYYCDVFLDERQTKILDKVLFFLQPIIDETRTKKPSNYLFKNYFAKFTKKKISAKKTTSMLPLASYLEVSTAEKEVLLKNLSKTSRKKIKDLF